MSSNWDGDLLYGLAQYAADAGAVTWTPNAVPVATTPVPLIVGDIPPTPATAVGLDLYSPVDDPDLSDTLQPVQFWLRAPDVLTLGQIGSDLYRVLHGLANVVIGGIPVSLIRRQSAAPQGRDGNGRYEASHNYYVYATRASLHNTD